MSELTFPGTLRRLSSAGRASASGARFLAVVVWLIAVTAGPVRADGSAHPLVDAAQSNDAGTVLALLARGTNVDQQAPDGTTALHWAVYHGDASLVERLIAAGAEVDLQNEYGSNPLSEAALVGDADIVRALLEAGADARAANADGQTPLMIVARTGSVDAARLLIEHGAAVNAKETWRGQTPLMWAAAQGQPEMIALLIEHGADPDARSEVNEWPRQVSAETRRMFRPSGGLTALLLAAREGCADCARRLVEGGADINLSDPDGVTPLIVAVDNLHFDTARYLVAAGADPNRWDWWGRTALYLAVDMYTPPAGGRPDRPSTDDTTALELIQQLLEAGANPNLQLKLLPPYRNISDDRGCDNLLTTGATPLLRAAKTFDVPVIRLLIERGANPELPNDSGITPVMAAAGLGSLECDTRGYGSGIPHYQTSDVQSASIAALEVLLDAGADVNARTAGYRSRPANRGQTALHGAAFWGWDDVARYLVERDARIDVADAAGRTPYDAALGRSGGHGRGQTIEIFADTAELLLELCAAEPACDAAALSSEDDPR